MSDYIPQDVLIDILTRLPAETLVRLTSVCKSWHSLITSPNFISHHLNRNANNDSLLVHCCNERPNQELYTLILDGEGCYWVPPEVEIYTLKTGNWRYISDKALPAMISKRYRQAYVNGAAHWMAYSQATQAAEFQPTILSFDMSGEVFNEILVPDSMDHGGFLLKSMILVVFKESLSLIEQCDCDCDYYPRCTVWIMKEYGVATSWAKLFRIDLCEGLRNPLGLRKNSEVIFETCDGNLVSCDVRNYGNTWHIRQRMLTLAHILHRHLC